MSRRLTEIEWEAMFWGRVKKTETCWLWQGPLHNGYGSVRFRGRSMGIHRAAYEFLVGPVPPPMQIDHICRVRNCVNPAHMEMVTGKVNTLRGTAFSAINAVKTHCPRGHAYDRRNTYLDAVGQRHCRACGQAAARRYRAERRGAYGRLHRPMSERKRTSLAK